MHVFLSMADKAFRIITHHSLNQSLMSTIYSPHNTLYRIHSTKTRLQKPFTVLRIHDLGAFETSDRMKYSSSIDNIIIYADNENITV